MANKEKIDYLLIDIRELEKQVASIRDAEVYPVSFFSQTFDLAHKILNDLHQLEANQVDMLRRQMEEHQQLLKSIPHTRIIAQPLPSEEEKEDVRETLEKVLEEEISIPATQQDETNNVSSEISQPKEQPQPVSETEQVEEQETEEIIQIETIPTTSLTTTIIGDRSGISLNEILEKKNLSDFRKAFSLNDRFRFRRDLFNGDESRMNKTISELNDIQTYEDSISYLHNELKWNIEDEAVADFIKLLEKRFL